MVRFFHHLSESACELFEKVLQKFPSRQEMAVLVFESAGLEVTDAMLLLESDAEELFM